MAAAAALTCGVQAQDNGAARLGIRARAADVTDTGVLAAIDARTVARTWLMRGTIHLVDAADFRWLVRLLGPSVRRKLAGRWRQLGLEQDLLHRSVDVLPQLLAGRAMTRHEIAAALAGQGVAAKTADPQVATHLVLHASTLGLICRGTDRGRDATFVLADEWLPDAPAGPRGDEALAELGRRFFSAFSPATAADFAAWSGLGAGRAITLIRDELTEVDVDGRTGFRLGDVEPRRGVRLLPAFDNYLIGYRDRDALLPPHRQRLVYNGGMISPTVLVDGWVMGVWSLDRSRKTARLAVRTFEQLRPTIRRALAAEADDLSRFFGRPVDVASVIEL